MPASTPVLVAEKRQALLLKCARWKSQEFVFDFPVSFLLTHGLIGESGIFYSCRTWISFASTLNLPTSSDPHSMLR